MNLPIKRHDDRNDGLFFESSSLKKLRDTIDSMFEDTLRPFELMRTGRKEKSDRQWIPSIDVKENSTEVIIKADIPNVNPKDVKIEIDQHALTMTGKTESEEEHKDDTWYRLERYSGSFYRSIPLPIHADADHARATVKNGVIEIRMPKKELPSQKKRLEIEES